jgi:hypothetical protein
VAGVVVALAAGAETEDQRQTRDGQARERAPARA